MVRTFAVLIAAVLIAPATLRAQDAKSPELAKQLAQLLDEKKLDSIAAADAQNAGVFVAALYFQGTQLLVVSAKYSAPQILTDRVTKKEYREVYIDLSSASVPGSKVFVMDTYADGLVAKPRGDNPPDSVERGDKTASFDGDWKKAKQTEADYMKGFAEADDEYARLLQMLITKVKSST